MVTDSLDVPTVGIGAGPGCDGQVLVYHDVLGIEDRITPKFVRRYADVKAASVAALAAYAADVRTGAFPAASESYHLTSRSEEHTSELQSLMRISYAVFCLKKQKK